jgi:hypothetical protein
MTIPVVYIAGPFRGPTPWDVECNVRHAEALSLEVARLGAMPLCPHTATRFFDHQLTDDFWLAGTMELLARCDGMVLVPGWERSTGSRGEVAFATREGIPIFDTDKDHDMGSFIQGLK